MVLPTILAIDEGTTNSKAILVGEDGTIISSGKAPVPIEHAQAGWVQQDANAIWQATQAAIKSCLSEASNTRIKAIGISNQRESVMIWDRISGTPLGNVITWQCRRTTAACEALKVAGHEEEVIQRTGLPLDPLFPPTKMAWLLNNTKQKQQICIGTVDSWLIWRLTGEQVHATDRSNASRTQLFNLLEAKWDDSLCELFGIDQAMLPTVKDSSAIFGETRNVDGLPDGIPIAAAIGDSHAALFGHGAFQKGDGKITFGTGSSVMATVPDFVIPPKGITTTVAWSINGTSTFAFEGNILVGASILPWTANLLGLKNVDELLALARTATDSNGVSLVPAHVGLGSPHWNSQARGLICGLSFAAGPEHVAFAALESMAFQVNDVFEIISKAAGSLGRMYVDGGPSSNPFLMQIVANALNRPITPGRDTELSALGAAYLAGLATGFWKDQEAIAGLPRHADEISPNITSKARNEALGVWSNAVARTMHAV